ncbi:hypothetical protein [Halosegnis sp.]|uniref:hypothetical protein n=1 Tax=Halosegnis sp. TaxID=2864959 RepID=UPI0035D3F443
MTLPFIGDDDDQFDPPDAFVPEHLPDPGPWLADHAVLTGTAHVDFHSTTRELFEQRGVYDVTFGYNLARLNRDRRYPDAGFRYAVSADEPAVLRAVFTPTTEFCPQTETLATAAFRAWNGLADRHDYDRVRVRVAPSHQAATAVNETLATLDERLRTTGTVPTPTERSPR